MWWLKNKHWLFTFFFLLPLLSWAQIKKEINVGYAANFDSLPKLNFSQITAEAYESHKQPQALVHPTIKQHNNNWLIPTRLGAIHFQKYKANSKADFKGVQYLGYLSKLKMHVAESFHTAEHIGFSDLFLIDSLNAYRYDIVSIGDGAVAVPVPSPKGSYLAYHYNEVYAKNSCFIGLLKVNGRQNPKSRLVEKMSFQTKDWAVEQLKWRDDNTLLVKGYTLNNNREKVYHYYLTTINAQAQLPKASPIFGVADPGCHWKYVYPFANKNYVVALKSCLDSVSQTKKQNLYFGKKKGQQDQVFWKESMNTTAEIETKTMDFNGDHHPDLLVFSGTGARGSNEYYHLYLAEPKNKTLTKVKGFEQIPNPSYMAKYQVIVAYSYAGKNYYSIYKINKNHAIVPIGKAFEDNFEGDAQQLEQKIKQLLKP